MNKVVLIGRLTSDPQVRYSTGSTPTAVARYSLAVDRRFKREGEQTADFINIVAFGKPAEFAEKYLQKGTKICVCGHIQTGSYTKSDGSKAYTTEVVVDEQEFVESKTPAQSERKEDKAPSADDFMKIPYGSDEDALPFS